MHIATGQPEDHPTPLPYDASLSPAVAPPTAVTGLMTPADQVPAFDAAADQADRLDGYEADVRAAQMAGQDARNAMLAHYSQDILPQGAAYGDLMDLPPVPANAVPSEGSDLYPFSGTEPTPAGAGMAGPYPAG
jgi:hypothetical protein